jgi:hypothetical protein
MTKASANDFLSHAALSTSRSTQSLA